MSSVLITGASRGLGRELVQVFFERGWTLFPLVRDPEVAASLESRYVTMCHPIVGDVGEADAGEPITRVLSRHTDSLDVLVNNAGNIKKLRYLPNTAPEDIESLFRVHCLGAFRCTCAALPFLRRAARPIVINMTSRWGSIARTVSGEFRGIYSYQIAKCAQNMLTACLDQELAKEGIRVFAVHPGKLTTEAGAYDADTPPCEAASKLADWIQSIDRSLVCGCHDLMSGGLIEW
jgi:NAD(P)-dependent dehydrogenase (short-subunit alcohol dehydrogenase family)